MPRVVKIEINEEAQATSIRNIRLAIKKRRISNSDASRTQTYCVI
jgi:hypothetical protein